MDKTFEPAAVEAKIAEAWAKADAFSAGRKSRKDAEGFCIVIPPPNVTGSLHIAMRSTTPFRTCCAATGA